MLFFHLQVHPILPQMVYNTLLELYIGEISGSPPEERQVREQRAFNLLKRQEVCCLSSFTRKISCVPLRVVVVMYSECTQCTIRIYWLVTLL